MKTIKVTKIIIIYNEEGVNIKVLDVSHLPWVLIYAYAIRLLASSLYGYKWKIIVEPK